MVAEAEAAFGSGSLSFSTNGGTWMNVLKSKASIITLMTGCKVPLFSVSFFFLLSTPTESPLLFFNLSFHSLLEEENDLVLVKILVRMNAIELAFVDDEVEYDDEMFPPHDLVAKGSGFALNPRRE
ncbi:uncharacterized protein G2W53_004507 [Senna tora]|uniref:Uncharacterized protein n=1 Tax=Senna tora TaxID=362788 RepID=A0A834XDB3_9FABA|nr:uncharacterized protein G2W53_004507 [Senna tora]